MVRSALSKILLILPLATAAVAQAENGSVNVLTDEQIAEAVARVNRNVAARALPAVVKVEARRRFGSGSGVIFDAGDGLILTNNHVVGGTDDIDVKLNDGRVFAAELIGTDPPNDLAVIRIDAPDLQSLPFGDSTQLQIGDPVMSVGNPFGLEGSVGKGIVSATERYTDDGIIEYEGFIQTDAVINPGNSGGPLVNMRGEIVGIIAAIESNSGGFDGVGYAIPSDKIQRVLPALVRGEEVVRGYLGVSITTARSSAAARRKGWHEPHGVYISEVLGGSPAEKAGLRSGDIVTSLDGRRLQQMGQLRDVVATTLPGTSIALSLWRDGATVAIDAAVGTQPSNFFTRNDPPAEDPDEVMQLEELGIEIATLTAELIEQFDIASPPEEGVVIVNINPEGKAGERNLKPGDVVIEVNETKVRDAMSMVFVMQMNREQNKVLNEGEPFNIELALKTARGKRRVRFTLDD